MFCAKLELYKLKQSDSSGIRKLTSIPFYKYMARKIQKRKSTEIAAFKVKYHILSMLTFGHSDLNILIYISPFDAKSIVLDF
jgi:hypothetical protein